MRSTLRRFAIASLALGLMGVGVTAQAALTWKYTGSDCGLSSCTVIDGTDSATANVSGWADVPAGSNLQEVTSSIVRWGSGLGIDRTGESSPDHAVGGGARNGTGPAEGLSFDFARDKIALNKLRLGWAENWQHSDFTGGYYPDYSARTSSSTADLRVYAWTGGAGSPTMTDWTWDTIQSESNAIDGVWALLNASTVSENSEFDFNVIGIESSFWLVAAERIASTGGDCLKPGASSKYRSCTKYDNNFFKLAKVGGEVGGRQPPGGAAVPGAAPVPIPLVLLAAGLPLLRLGRRRRWRPHGPQTRGPRRHSTAGS